MDPLAAAFTDLVLETFRFNGRLLAAGDRLAAPVGLTSARWQVLGAIEAEPLPVSDIARAMGLTRQSVQRTVDVLAAEGVVTFADNPRHRRAKLVRPSPSGRAMLEKVGVLQKAWAREIAEGMDEAALRAALAVLGELRCRLDRAEEGEEGRPCGRD